MLILDIYNKEVNQKGLKLEEKINNGNNVLRSG